MLRWLGRCQGTIARSPPGLNIRLLTLALDDLEAGCRFYERQKAGLGEYYLDSLFSDIDSLLLYAGIHQKVFGYYRTLSRRFP